MTTNEHDAVLDQIYFRYDYTAEGLSVGASSFPRPEQEKWWLASLKNRLRLQPAQDGSIPNDSLSYLVLEEHAAVMWRYSSGPTAGRNDSRAVVGPAALFTPDLAIDMRSWAGWSAQPLSDGPLARVPIAELPSADERARFEADAGIVVQQEAAAVLARMLAEPDRPVSVWGHRTDAVVLVWAIREAGEAALRRRGGTPLWTFSTWEVRHDNGVTGLPEVVFLPEQQLSAGASVHRVQVDLTLALGSGEAAPDEDYARRLVAHRFAGGPRPVDPRARQHRHAVRGGEVRDFHNRPTEQIVPGAVVPPGAATNRPLTSTAGGPTGMHAPVGGGGRVPTDGPATIGGRQPGTGWPSDSPVEKAVQHLVGARTSDKFFVLLAEVGRSARDGSSRGRVRAQIEALGGWERLADNIDGRFRDECYASLIDATFGPHAADAVDYPAQAGRDAAALISSTQYPLLARRLTESIRGAAAARSAEVPTAVTQAVVERFAQSDDPPHAAGVVQRLKQARHVLARGRIRRLVAGAVVLAALAFLAGGLLWGRVNGNADIAGRLAALQGSVDALGGAGTGSPAATTTEVPTLPPFPWGATLAVPEGQLVAVFVKAENTQYLGAICAGDMKPVTERSSVTCPDPRNGGGGATTAVIAIVADPAVVAQPQAQVPGQVVFQLPS
ncbi:hypothetical protein [Pseudonocardia lacus]|uniref:hypothetical protein n=1 Tax=Pseudonocardia lacus TaxID=2835865 RepID=UPI001BDD8B64|nr:hypothetical protein [Pseudonocardia lacus]